MARVCVHFSCHRLSVGFFSFPFNCLEQERGTSLPQVLSCIGAFFLQTNGLPLLAVSKLLKRAESERV